MLKNEVIMKWQKRFNINAKYYFEKFCSKDNGLKHLLIRSGFLGVFWIVAFLVVYSIMIRMLSDIIRAYKQYPLVTQIKIDGAQFQFPDVTICPKSPFSDVSDPNFRMQLEKISNETEEKLRKASVKITKESLQSGILLQLLKYDNAYAVKLYLHIIHCEYNGEECSFYNFTEIVHPRYIKCFEFKPHKRNIRTGMGLSVIYLTNSLKDPFMILNDLEDLNFFSRKENDGINILVHNPLTFPSHEINYLPTSFSLRYGTQTSLAVTSLKYNSNLNYRKPCFENPNTFKYQNFRGDNRFFEYNYTYEDCIANKKQLFINKTCGCYSDKLFVPYLENSTQSISSFCRYILDKTSEQIRRNFFCHEIQTALSSTDILDKYLSPKDLLDYKNDQDALKLLRLNVCSMSCFKDIYETKLYQLNPIDDLKISSRKFKSYYEKLKAGQFINPEFENLYNSHEMLNGSSMINLIIKSNGELIDVWQEERSTNIVSLMSEFGGIMGLCAGISFLMSIVLISYLFICLMFYFFYFFVNCLSLVVFKENNSDNASSSSDKKNSSSRDINRVSSLTIQSDSSIDNGRTSRGDESDLPSIGKPIATRKLSDSYQSDNSDDRDLEEIRLQDYDKNYKNLVPDSIDLPDVDNLDKRIRDWL